TMQPIRENLNYSADGLRRTFPKYFTPDQAKAYARQPQRIANRVYANRMGNGNEASGDGYRFLGEGDVQNTGRANAARATKELNALFGIGVDLVANPAKRGDPFISAHSLFLGNKEGWWTGKKLGDFIKPGVKVDFINARRVVNIMDEAEAIARYANAFLVALKAAGPIVAEPVPATPPTPTPTPPKAPQSFWASLMAFVTSLFKKG
ncbi:hypothetical protein ACQKHB_23120, partial [Escherichia coli]